MPFSSLHDPVDVARSQAALDAAWEKVRIGLGEVSQERERTRLAVIVASLAPVAVDETDLVERALERYWKAAE